MTYEPSDKMVQAIAKVMFPRSDLFDEPKWEKARAALRAAFAAAIESGEGTPVVSIKGYEDQQWMRTYGGETPDSIILRTQEGEK